MQTTILTLRAQDSESGSLACSLAGREPVAQHQVSAFRV